MRTIFLALLLSLPAQIIFSQMDIQETAVFENIENNFAKQLLIFPQEKIYMHTDKPYYINGEKIFFRAFLLDAFSNKQDTLSRYVYVELINPADSVAQRLKILSDSTHLFYGALSLPEDLPQGIYKIRAYTQYMNNQGENSFFSKYVRISDPQILDVQTESDFQYAEDGKINASLRFVDAKTQNVIQPKSVVLRINQERQFTGKPDKEGWIRVKLNVPSQAATRVLYVESINDRRVFKQYIRIPYPEGDFDVTFYPEGGHLISGQSSNVAFKALGVDGRALNIKGEIVDSKGDILGQFNTIHDGMGEFFLNTLPGEHYQAVCHNSDRTLRFDLPEAQANAFALKTINRDNKLWVTINKSGSTSLPILYLLVHSGGLVIYAKAWNTSKDFVTFDVSAFPSGISHILLLTKDLKIVSERLVFLLNNDQGVTAFQTQKDAYLKREQVQVAIQLKDGKQLPLKGNFSIAVTNDRDVATDSTSSILSDILLRSELRGQIDNPEYYFQKGNKEAEQAADLLMKTHGWTRYAIPDVIKGKLTYPKIPYEVTQIISGTVKSGLLSKLAKDFKVSLISLNLGFFSLSETDENGRYVFGNFDFPDSTKFVIQALNSKGKGKQMTELYVDEDTFPGVRIPWTDPIVQGEKTDPALMDYVAKADLHYTYENGARVINLPELEVKGINKDKEKDKYKSSLYTDPDYSISEDDLTKFPATSIKDLLYRIPGVFVTGDNVSIRMAGGPPLVVIDDMPYEPSGEESVMDILNLVNVNDVGKIDILKNASNTAIYGMRGGNGVIVIYTKKGDGGRSPLPSFNIKPLTPLGFQLPVEFYSPKYDTQESINSSIPDLRTTIYWKPNVLTDDNGNAKIDFYTADDPATYSVIIEGVSNDGKLIRYRGKANITVK
jgi:TonB-dependent SusC/RagA subfamily outer membrane receptor